MDTIIVTADIVSALFLAIILPGLYRVTPDVAEKTKYYRYCIWICLLGSLAKAFSYVIDGNGGNNFFVTLSYYYALIFIDLLIACFSFYLYSLIKEKEKNHSKKFLYFICGLSALDFLGRTIGSLTGKLFRVYKGNAIEGPWIQQIVVIPLVCVICISILLICKAKKIGYKNAMILGSYIILPTISAVVQVFKPEYAFGYASSSLALATIYVMIQSNIIAEANFRANLYSNLSTRDVLTGLKNRRGYLETLKEIPEDEEIAIIFCDINALKFVNDNIGHEEGDQLIKKMANILNEQFTDSEIFRISGDEFVVIFRNVNMTGLEERISKLKDLLMENDRIASFGFEFGKGSEVNRIVTVAERKMYEDKKRYYEETGRDRRM